MLRYKEFINEAKLKTILLSGIVIIYNKKVLLVFPKKRSKDEWSIPKGKVDVPELPINAAIRETFEETGIKVKKHKLIYGGEFGFRTKRNEIKLFKYWLYFIKDLSEIGLKTEEVPSQMLTHEISKAKFFTYDEALIYLRHTYLDILYNIEKQIK